MKRGWLKDLWIGHGETYTLDTDKARHVYNLFEWATDLRRFIKGMEFMDVYPGRDVMEKIVAVDNLLNRGEEPEPEVLPCPFGCKMEPEISPLRTVRCVDHTNWIEMERWNDRPGPRETSPQWP